MNSNAILVITENFAFGGLETQLWGYFRQLKKRNFRIVLAVGEKIDADNPFIEFVDEIVSGLSLHGGLNNIEFRNAYAGICNLIDEHSITAIHCEPFFAFLPAFFASQEKKVPFIYSLHGPASITHIETPFQEFLLKEMVLKYASIVHCVSPEIVVKSYPFTSSNAFLVPNLVNTEVLAPVKSNDANTSQKNAWAVFSRLDEPKIKGIIDFIQKAAVSNITSIDIYGDGPARKQLENWIFNNQAAAIAISLKGFYKLDAELVSKYEGVAGMGRVVLETLSINKPCVLIGYDGIKGLVDKDLLEYSSTWNFSGRGLKTISGAQLASDFKKLEENKEQYCLREQVIANYDEEKRWQPFIDRLTNLEFREYPLTKIILGSIQAFENPDEPVLNDTQLLSKISHEYAEKKMKEDLQMILSSVQQMNGLHQSNESLRTELYPRGERQNEISTPIDKVFLENNRLENELRETRALLQKANVKIGVTELLREDLKEKETIKRELENRIKQLEKNISWYQQTYETRSLLGIVKDKALKKIKSNS